MALSRQGLEMRRLLFCHSQAVAIYTRMSAKDEMLIPKSFELVLAVCLKGQLNFFKGFALALLCLVLFFEMSSYCSLSPSIDFKAQHGFGAQQ